MADRRRFAVPVAVSATLVLAGGAVAAYATARSPGSSYRTATAAVRTVSATLPATGTVRSKSAATVSFPIAGTVAGVSVAPGDRVVAGAELATLDTTELEKAVAAAKAELAQARLTLEQDETASDSGTSASSGAGGTGTASWSAPAGSSPGGASQAVTEAQRAVQQAQQRADTALATAAAALAKATAVCSGGSPPGWTMPTPAPTPSGSAPASPTAAPTATSTTPTATPAPSATPSSPPAGGDTAACTAALRQVLADQIAVQRAQQAVSQRQAALTRALAAAAAASGTAPPSSSAEPGSGSSGSGGAAGSGGRSSTGSAGGASSDDASSGAGEQSGAGGVVTDEQLAADSAKITAAEAAVAVAEQSLRQATIVSPIAGTVAAVSLARGDRVSAGSGTATVSVVGDDGHVVTVGVPVADVGRLKVGQRATVRPDGTSAVLPAKVVTVGVAPTATGGTTYAVTLGFTGRPAGLRDGTSATVSITTAESTSALAVPTSAVTRLGPSAFVTVLENGQPRRTPVEVGAVGPTYTEITSGLAAGAEVVLADLDRAVPTSSTQPRFGAGRGGLVGPGGGGFGGPPPR